MRSETEAMETPNLVVGVKVLDDGRYFEVEYEEVPW